MKRTAAILCMLLLGIFFCTSCSGSGDTRQFTATVLDNRHVYITVQPDDGNAEVEIRIDDSVTLLDSSGNEIGIEEIQKDTKVRITHDKYYYGDYPTVIDQCIKVQVV